MQGRSPAVCKEFMEFMKGHEERMRRAERVANDIKVGHDKKKRKLLGELDQTVILSVLCGCFLIKTSALFLI